MNLFVQKYSIFILPEYSASLCDSFTCASLCPAFIRFYHNLYLWPHNRGLLIGYWKNLNQTKNSYICITTLKKLKTGENFSLSCFQKYLITAEIFHRGVRTRTKKKNENIALALILALTFNRV